MKDYDLLVWTPEMVRNFWDYEANFPANFFTRSHRYQIIKKFESYLPSRCTVLDYGCGPGNLIGPLLEAGFSVAAMDTSQLARELVLADFGDNKQFLGVYDQHEIDASGLKFDAIIAAEVIEHLYDDQLDSLLETLGKLSGSNTHIIFTTPNEEDLQESYILCPESGKLFHRFQHVRSWSEATIKSFLEARQFRATRTFTTDFDLTLAIRGKHNPLRGRWWESLRRIIRNRLQPQRHHPHLVVVTQPSVFDGLES
jgi:2-polyprenyl-3-methyl-5-hydroxy-6-metoxy-1,4-benzoquinol methylase